MGTCHPHTETIFFFSWSRQSCSASDEGPWQAIWSHCGTRASAGRALWSICSRVQAAM